MHLHLCSVVILIARERTLAFFWALPHDQVIVSVIQSASVARLYSTNRQKKETPTTSDARKNKIGDMAWFRGGQLIILLFLFAISPLMEVRNVATTEKCKTMCSVFPSAAGFRLQNVV